MLRFTFSMRIVAVLVFTLLIGCARSPLKKKTDSLRRVSPPSSLFASNSKKNDLSLSPLVEAIRTEVELLKKSDTVSFDFGADVFTRGEYIVGLESFLERAKTAASEDELYQSIRDDFNFYEVYGDRSWGDVFITSYFEPVISGSLKPNTRHSVPLYANPKDIIRFDLKQFQPVLSDIKDSMTLKGRIQDQTLVPYYTREEISTKHVLRGRKLEICWVDPLDAFFLEIQGSGTVQLAGGAELHVNYAESNGHRYESIGKFVKNFLPEGQINLRNIETYLRSLSREEAQRILNLNPSHVFFEVKKVRSVTTLQVPATAGRTIATDARYFPKGALAILSFEKPVLSSDLDSHGAAPQASTIPITRFVLDQDTGGAIKGGGRVDLFWGSGNEAKKYAGEMKSRGRLLYLAPKRKVQIPQALL